MERCELATSKSVNLIASWKDEHTGPTKLFNHLNHFFDIRRSRIVALLCRLTTGLVFVRATSDGALNIAVAAYVSAARRFF